MFKTHKKIVALLITMAFMTCTFTSLFGNFLPKTKIYAETSKSENTINYGDLNNDDTITVRDSAIAKRMLLQQNVNADFSYPEEADVNADAAYDADDLSEIDDYVINKNDVFFFFFKRAINSVERNTISPEITTDIGVITPFETQLTPEMIALTDSLETPMAIYEYIVNNVNSEFYYGLRKGAMGTYEQNGGNDYDISSLLIAMFRYLGYTAYYATTQVYFTENQLLALTTAENIDAALKIYNSQGRKIEKYDNTYYLDSEYIFVVLEIDNAIYPIDGFFKQYEVKPEFSEYQERINSLNLEDNLNYSSLPENVENDISVNEVFPKHRIIAQNVNISMNLPYEWLPENTIIGTYLVDNQFDWIDVYLDGNSVLSFPSAYLYNKNLTVEYRLTEDAAYFLDESFNINSLDDLTKSLGTYNGFVDIEADVKLDGEEIYSGLINELGAKQELTVKIRSGGETISANSELVYGGIYSIVFDYQIISAQDIMESYSKLPQTKSAQSLLNENNIYESDSLKDMLTLLGKSYFAQLDSQNTGISELSDIYYERSISVAVVQFTPNIIEQSLGTVFEKKAKISIDLIGNNTKFLSTIGDIEEEKKIKHSSGFMSSYLESKTVNQFTGLSCISTAEILQKSIESDVDILYISAANVEDLNNSLLDAQNKADILKEINNGKYVTVPNDEITIGDWSGTGYIIYDPLTDSSLYMINNNLNGGSLCSWVGFSYLCDLIATIVECVFAFDTMIFGVTLFCAAFAAAPLFIVISGMLLGSAIFLSGAFYLRNIGDRFYESTDLMDDYINGDEDAGKQLTENTVKHIAYLGVAYVGAKTLSRPVSNWFSKTHIEKKFDKLITNSFGNTPGGYAKALDLINFATSKGYSDVVIKTMLKNKNCLAYTDRMILSMSKLKGEAVETIVNNIAKQNGDDIFDIVYQLNDDALDTVMKLISENGDDFVRNISVIGKVNATASETELLSLYNAATRQTTRIADNVVDETIINRVKEIRSLLTSDLKKSGNFGIAKVDISGIKTEYYAHSKIDFLNNAGTKADLVKDICLMPSDPVITAVEAPLNNTSKYLRNSDTEYKILNTIAKQLGNNKSASGSIILFTERPPCESCENVIVQFLQKYPDINIEVIHNGGIILK